MGEKLNEWADVYDLDGTLLYREQITMFLSALRSRNPWRKIPNISEFDHGRAEGNLSGIKERISYFFHMNRVVIPGVRDLMAKSYQEGADIYIVTGRSSKACWYDGTKNQLERVGILAYVRDPSRRLHTPGGRFTACSKLHALYEISKVYRKTRMTDDDWPTVHLLATKLPNVLLRYVYHGFPCIYPPKHPNISIIDLAFPMP